MPVRICGHRRPVWCGLLLAGLIGSVAAGQEKASPRGHTQPLKRLEYLQIRMGIPFRITLYAADEAVANRAVDRAYARIRELDRILSDYDPDSEVNRLCREAVGGKGVAVSPELLFVLKKSLALSRQTDGAFDVTVGPVVSLWRRARREKKLPDPAELAAARERIGYELIELDEDAGTVSLKKEGMKLDFGGIAKGYAGDEALRILAEAGITRVLIAGSGDIVAGDPPPDRSGWRIGIASLADPEGTPSRFLELANAAVSTSGDTYQFIEIDGVRYSHIVDPQTGVGMTNRRSVTVIAPRGIEADPLATVGCIFGAGQGIKFLEQRDHVEGLFAERIGADLDVQTTRCFRRWEADAK